MSKPRQTKNTVKFVDEYCETYRDLFPEVRTFEYFKKQVDHNHSIFKAH